MKQTYFKIPGWFNYSETYDVIADEIADDGKIVEIGSFLGRSTHYLATALVNANNSHRELNGQLRKEIDELKSDNKKLAKQVEDLKKEAKEMLQYP